MANICSYVSKVHGAWFCHFHGLFYISLLAFLFSYVSNVDKQGVVVAIDL